MQFIYEDLGEVKGQHTFLVRLTEGWVNGSTILGVVRQATRSRVGGPLLWTGALSTEADPAVWDKKATKSFVDREHCAVWLLGVRDFMDATKNNAAAARAVRDEEIRRLTGPNLCPACGKLAVADYNKHPDVKSSFGMGSRDDIDCGNCGTTLFRINYPAPNQYDKPVWQLASGTAEVS